MATCLVGVVNNLVGGVGYKAKGLGIDGVDICDIENSDPVSVAECKFANS